MSGWPPTTPKRGESPGVWVGSGMAPIDGLSAGDPVTAEQMRSLFGAGMHPLATQRLEQLDATELTDTNVRAATQLGLPFKVYSGEVSAFRVEVAKRIAAQQTAAGQSADEPISATDRARVRTEVAREFFRAEHGRDPIDAREIAATIAKESRPRTQTWPAVEQSGVPKITFHGLRHSFVAILVAAGCNVREVSEWAGHNSVAFTLTRYGGLFEDGSDAAIDRLDALLGAELPSAKGPAQPGTSKSS